MFIVLLAALLTGSLSAQAPEHDHSQMDHSKMDHSKMGHGTHSNAAGSYLMILASGTSMNPLSWPMPMLMPRIGSWNVMLMGQGFLVDTQQSGPRGGDKFYSANWAMISAEHTVGRGSF